MVHCVVPMCKTNSKIDKKMSFHQFPSDEKRLQLWLQNINKINPMKSEWIINQYSTVCGLHFMESDFKPFAKNRILKPDAVPTIFPISKDSKPNVTCPKRNRKASIPKKTPNKENITSDENIHLMDIADTSGFAPEHDQTGSEEEQDQADSEEEQYQAGSYKEHDQDVSDEEQDQAGSEAEHDQSGSETELGLAGSEAEKDQANFELEKFQADSFYTTESNRNIAYHSEKTSKRAKLDAGNISSEDIPISSTKQFYTAKDLKQLIRESKIKCAEKKLALVKEKLASKVVSRALQKALVVSKIKAETAKTDFYERKKIFLLQTKISHLKNEVPVSEEKFQTLEYLQSKIMEEELATRIEERALQKQVFEAEIQASNEKQTYYVTKKTWLPIFMDHSDMK